MIVGAIQIFLALAFAAAVKMVRSTAQLAANRYMGWVQSMANAQIKLLGVAEIPACLATLMGRAVATHAMGREPAAAATILAVLTIVVATFR
jgi:hypothetical protein